MHKEYSFRKISHSQYLVDWGCRNNFDSLVDCNAATCPSNRLFAGFQEGSSPRQCPLRSFLAGKLSGPPYREEKARLKMSTFHFSVKAGSKGKGACATIHAEYILRVEKYAIRTDLESTGYGNLPKWCNDNPVEFWRASDIYERKNGVVYREHELALPIEATPKERKDLIEDWCNRHYKNHAYLFAIHYKEGNPHCHIMVCDRKQDGIERNVDQYFKREASIYRDRTTKELKKSDPAKGGCPKSDKWNGKDRDRHLERLRKSWADLQNGFYKTNKYINRVDHRSLRAQQKETLENIRTYEDFDCPDLAAEERIKFARLDREPDHRADHRRYRILQRTGQLEELNTFRQANRESAEAKAELLAERENRHTLYKQQQAIYAARAAALKVEYLRRDQFRANRRRIKSVGRLAASLLPRPLGEAIQIATEILSMIAKMNDWRQACVYKRLVDQLTTHLNQVKATRLAADKVEAEKVKPFVPVSSAPATALNQNEPTPQQPALKVYGPEDTASALLTQANKETGRQRALYLKIADRVEQLPPGTIIYQREAELPPKQLLETAAAAVKTWQEANPDETKAHAEAWDMQHPDLAALLAVVADVSGSKSFKPQELAAVALITAYPSQIARQYRDYAQVINNSDSAKARTLMAICNMELNKISNAKEITLPTPSAKLIEIRSALKQQGITGGRGR